jgi:hypothetical protein
MQRIWRSKVFPPLAADRTRQQEKGSFSMRKLLIASLAVAALGTAACSEKSQQATENAGDAIAQDAATAGDAIAHDAAVAGDKIEAGANKAADATANAARDAGNVIEGTVNAAGDAVNKAGDKIATETQKAKAND